MKPLIILLTLLTLINFYGSETTGTRNEEPLLSLGRGTRGMENSILLSQGFPQSEEAPIETLTAVVTAYTLSVDKTDGKPEVGACGRMDSITSRIIACPRNFICGDMVEIDGVEYTCWDRMALKNDGMFDILMDSKEEALIFGRQIKQIKIIK